VVSVGLSAQETLVPQVMVVPAVGTTRVFLLEKGFPVLALTGQHLTGSIPLAVVAVRLLLAWLVSVTLAVLVVQGRILRSLDQRLHALAVGAGQVTALPVRVVRVAAVQVPLV